MALLHLGKDTTVTSKAMSDMTIGKKTRFCSICDKDIPGTGNLSFHMALHPVDNPKICHYCIQVFRTKEELLEHTKCEHESIKRFKCEFCPQKFIMASNLKRHNLIHNKNTKPFKCPYCDDPFNNYEQWRKHEVQHRGFTEFICSLCNVGFWKEEKFLIHTEAGMCKSEISCCDDIYTRSEYVKHFQEKHHRTIKEDHPCKFCNKLFPYISTKRHHELVCTKGENPDGKPRRKLAKELCSPSPVPNEAGLYVCSHCNMVLSSVMGLKSHISRLHSALEESVRKYQCPFCEKRFETYGGAHLHKQTHLKIHFCTICSKRFSHKFLLRNHMYSHEKKKPFKCTYCDKCFASKPQVMQHENGHTGNRPFKCRFCTSCFKRRTSLRCHELIHLGTRPHKCKICGQGFTQLSTVKQHEKAHSKTDGKKKFFCKDCPAQFWSITQQKAHKRLVHEPTPELMTIQEQIVAEENWVETSEMCTDEQGNVYLFVET